jgi:serine/threonine protein kinase
MELSYIGDISKIHEHLNNNLIFKNPFFNKFGDNLIRLFCKQIITGIKTFYEGNLVHFDIKPDNILIFKGLELKVIDFSFLTKLIPDKKERIPGGTFGYTTPEFYGTKLAFSYAPDSYSESGLINKHSRYDNRSSYAAGLYHHLNLDFMEIESSLGYAYNHKNNQEASVGLSLYRKGWTLGGSYRKSWTTSSDFDLNLRTADDMLDYFDGYRRGQAFNVGLSYEIGPFKTGAAYFASYADKTDHKDQIISWTNRFSLNKYTAVYLLTAYASYKGEDIIANNNRGYVVAGGLELNF